MRRIVPMALGALAAIAIAVVVVASLADRGETGPAHEGITVYAAASLEGVVEDVAQGIRDELPWARITVAYGGSSDLAAQIFEGAPAALFLSADESQARIVAEGLDLEDTASVAFATNTLTLVVAAGNPAGITGLEDLSRSDLAGVVCAPQVPCGAATVEVARRRGITLAPVSEERSVTDVLAKVASGQADVGVVYVTDIARSDGVEAVSIDGADAVVNRYVAVGIPGEHDGTLAARFWDDLTGEPGRAALAAAGFGAP